MPQLQPVATNLIDSGVLVSEFIASHMPMAMTIFSVQPGCHTPIDQHGEHELWIVLSGTGLLTYEAMQYCISEHEVYYFAPYTSHQIVNHAETYLKILSIYWHH